MWDVDTVTAADFTVESIISQAMWDSFLRTQSDHDETNLLNIFKEEYTKEVERVTQQEIGVLSDADVKIKVSHITFAFDNVQLLKLL